MGKITDALKSAAKVTADEYAARTAESDARGPGDRFSLVGVNVQCSHCRHDRFTARFAVVNQPFVPEWLDDRVSALICTKCSHIMWFGDSPRRLDG